MDGSGWSKSPLQLTHEGEFRPEIAEFQRPVAAGGLIHLVGEGQCFQAGQRVVLVGFGVGYSWAACDLVWN